MTVKPVIVVLAYNRPHALRRLLGSLAAAEYPQGAKLLISLEGCASEDVVKIACEFECEKLEVEIVQREKKLGLRAHVISCADLSEEYGSVVLLEDDLAVDRYFYLYACEALAFYEADESVAGIALYSYEYNELTNLPFTPMANGYDTYPMQLACSWGQCWSSEQWRAFKSWYVGKKHADLEKIELLPPAVKNWPESSWKKYFHGFMIEQGKHFIYPYQPYSTNCSDAGGEHIKNGSFLHQVSMATPVRPKPNFNFSPIDNQEVVYDSFMEPVGDFVWRALGYRRDEIEIDLQGIKPIDFLKKKEWVVTSKNCREFVRTYGLIYRPLEMNLESLFSNEGSGTWYLVRTNVLAVQEREKSSIEWFSYHLMLDLNNKETLFMLFMGVAKLLVNKVGNKLKRVVTKYSLHA